MILSSTSPTQVSSTMKVSTEITKLVSSADFTKKALTIVIVGASGHLARTQVIPAIFSLYCKKLLPHHFHLVGYARSNLDDSSFRGDTLKSGLHGYESHETHNMTKLEDSHGNDERKEHTAASTLLSIIGLTKKNDGSIERVDETDRSLRKKFLQRCYYQKGKYDQVEDFAKLHQRLQEIESQEQDSGSHEKPDGANRVFYLAIPPPQFESALEGISSNARTTTGWNRVVIEKPFGEDFASAQKLNQLVANKFKEDEIYRIDHFMGKETLLNILPLRFANIVYNSLWSKESIHAIVVNVKESFGLEGRAGYFDKSGIVRDMIQNHLFSIAALLTMEEPAFNNDTALHESKTRLFQAMKPISSDDIVFGQYGKSADGKKKAYAEEDDIEQGSKTSTYVALVAHIDNERWRGVPIALHCGKALDATKSEIYVHFKSVNGTLYAETAKPNSLTIKLAPQPSIVEAINVKQPGLADAPEPAKLELEQKEQEEVKAVPTAYERLIFDVIRGVKQLFVSREETEAAWRVIDPAIKEFEAKQLQPIVYQFGSHGPQQAQQLFNKYQIPIKLEKL